LSTSRRSNAWLIDCTNPSLDRSSFFPACPSSEPGSTQCGASRASGAKEGRTDDPHAPLRARSSPATGMPAAVGISPQPGFDSRVGVFLSVRRGSWFPSMIRRTDWMTILRLMAMHRRPLLENFGTAIPGCQRLSTRIGLQRKRFGAYFAVICWGVVIKRYHIISLPTLYPFANLCTLLMISCCPLIKLFGTHSRREDRHAFVSPRKRKLSE
jgi:hypothetical protein